MRKIIYISLLVAFMTSCTKSEILSPFGNDVTVPGAASITDGGITDPDKDPDHDGESTDGGITDPDKNDDHDGESGVGFTDVDVIDTPDGGLGNEITDPDKDPDHDGEITDPDKDDNHDQDATKNSQDLN